MARLSRVSNCGRQHQACCSELQSAWLTCVGLGQKKQRPSTGLIARDPFVPAKGVLMGTKNKDLLDRTEAFLAKRDGTDKVFTRSSKQ